MDLLADLFFTVGMFVCAFGTVYVSCKVYDAIAEGFRTDGRAHRFIIIACTALWVLASASLAWRILG